MVRERGRRYTFQEERRDETMPATEAIEPTSQAAIFTRVWEQGNGFSSTLARHITKLEFSERDKARMHELAAMNQEDRLDPAERQELDNYVVVADLLALLQSKARKSLKKRR